MSKKSFSIINNLKMFNINTYTINKDNNTVFSFKNNMYLYQIKDLQWTFTIYLQKGGIYKYTINF